ncbi:DgyrCDS14608 [Dimorphilus gyrociliatus]|uniref:DgyrCDS14608 n=1 Tax=Dimorphilus gyrociliatus TaxID=2664684 RepID=A0A7I8WE78_9ANNE|nr:DgyrCDS14608 [Dimorphilus gyrociliatus]
MKIFAIISIYFILSESCYFRNVEVEGDFYLATFLAFHTDEYCTGPISEAILYQYEALLWAVERLNNHSFFGKERIGLKVFDTCFSKFHTSNYLIDDILKHDTLKINYISSLYNCSDTEDNVVGILGPTTSAISETISTFLKKTNTEMATFGISATLTSLSNEEVFPNFFRVVPPDIIQTQSLASLMEKFGWNFILTMSTDDSYGTEGLKELHEILKDKKICYIQCPLIKIGRIYWPEWGQKFYDEIYEKINFETIGIVFYGQPETFKTAVETLGRKLRNKAANLTWIVTESYTEEIKDMSQNPDLANFTVLKLELSHTLGLKEVNRYLQEKSGDTIMNPWWAECQQKKTTGDCSLKQYHKFPPKYTTSALDALYFYAQAIKNGLNENKCKTYRHCLELRSHVIKFLKGAQLDYIGQQWSEVIPEEFKGRNISLDETGDLNLDSKNEILTIKSFHLKETDGEGDIVGYISKKLLNLANEKLTKTLVGKSQCPVGTKCTQYCEDNTKLKHAYVKSNVSTKKNKKNKSIIIAILPINENSDRTDPNEIVNLKCSNTARKNSAGYQLFEAFKYAIEKYSTNLEGIAFDDCYNPLRPAKIFTDLLSGEVAAINIKGERVTVNKDDVIAIIGTESSDVTRNIAPFAEQLKVVQISFGATAVVFDNKKLFPNFLRTVPSDSAQAEAMVKVAVKLNWKCACIIHTTNLYGNGGAEKLEEYAKKYGIFISFKRNFTSQNENEPSGYEYTQIITKLQDENSPHQIFYFGDNQPVKGLLEELKKIKDWKKFLFIASESWGDSKSVVKGSEGAAENAITIKINSPTGKDVNKNLDKYLDNITFKFHKNVNNPWYNKFYQKINECYLQESWQKPLNAKECALNISHSKVDRSGRQFCYHVITSVIAVNEAVKLINARGDQKSAAEYKEYLRQEKPFLKIFKQAELPNTKAKIFNEDGNGKSLYSLYYYTKKDKNTYEYTHIESLDFDIGIIKQNYKVVNQCKDPPLPSRNVLLLVIIVMSCAMGVIVLIACSFGIYKIVSFFSRTRRPKEVIRNQTNLEIHNWISQTNDMARPNHQLRGDDDSIAFESVVHSAPSDTKVSFI